MSPASDGLSMPRIIECLTMQRRDFLRLSGPVAAALAWRQLFAIITPTQPVLECWTESADVFTLGVASGEPLPSSVVIWTRLAPKPLQADGGMPPQPVPVRWEVANDPRFAQIVRQGEALALPGRAHSVHVEVQGLESDRIYHYRFIAAGQASSVGRTRTAPDPDARVQRLRLALGSCQHYEQGYFTAHRDIARSDVDAVVFVGDYIYETDTIARGRLRRHVSGLMDDLSLDRFRVHHASYKLDADLRACHEAHPWLLTWDDHEVRNDYDGDHDNFGMSTEELLKVRTDGYRAYFEHLPISPTRAPVGANAQMHTRYSWGRLADIWLLDTRQYRSEQACTSFPKSFWRDKMLWHCDATAAPERTMLGHEQEQWLARSLATSRGAWRIIAQSTQMTPGTFKPPGAEALLYSDGWDAFPAARQRLMTAIAQPRVPDVVVLSGDVHRHVAGNLRLNPNDPQSAIIASEFATSSISSSALSEFLHGWMKASNPDLLYLRGDERGYALIDVTPEQMRCDFKGTAHPVRADSRFHTQASYVVERGVAGPRQA